jgi:hypothetical protein
VSEFGQHWVRLECTSGRGSFKRGTKPCKATASCATSAHPTIAARSEALDSFFPAKPTQRPLTKNSHTCRLEGDAAQPT